MKKILIFLLLINLFASTALAGTMVDGLNGNSWYGNVSTNNTIITGNQNIILDLEVQGYSSMWDFKAGSGTVLWDSNRISANDGSITGSGNWISGGGYDFITTLIDVGSSLTNPNKTIFINFTADSYGYYGRLICNQNDTVHEMRVYTDVNNIFMSNYEAGSTDASTYNEYTHGVNRKIIIEFNATSKQISYWNSSEESTTQTIGTNIFLPTTINTSIGNRISGGAEYDGKIYHIIYYEHILEQTEKDSIYNLLRQSSGDITRNYTAILGTSDELKTLTYNGSTNSGQIIDLYASTDNVSWILVNSSHPSNVSLDVSGNGYKYGKWKLNTTDISKTPEIYNITGTYDIAISGSVDITYYNLNYSNLTSNVLIDISNKTGNLTVINLPHIGNKSSEYCLHYPNGTVVQSCVTCTGEGDTVWFNGSADRLPELNGYYINETVDSSTMNIPANSWGIFNNWTETTTFAAIATNESNDICYTYYNVTSGLWESYYVGYSWNANYQLSKDASVMGYFDAQTDITSDIITPSSTELFTGWNMLGIQSSSNQTISGIIADIGTNCSDSWYFNSSTGSYSNTTTHSIQPNQGFLAYITQNMTWSRSAM